MYSELATALAPSRLCGRRVAATEQQTNGQGEARPQPVTFDLERRYPEGTPHPLSRAAALDRAPEEASSLLDAARSAALDALGDSDGALTIAERRLRAGF